MWDYKLRLMSQVLRKLSAHINNQNVIIIFLNQIRGKVGSTFINNNETSAGGSGVKILFHSKNRCA